MAGVAGEDKLVVITFPGKHASHVFVGLHPVVHAVAHVVVVVVANFQPEAQRLDRAVRNQRFVIAPGTVRCFGIPRPLVVDVSTRVGEHAG